MDEKIKDLFPLVVVLFGTIWAAHAADVQTTKYINDIRNSVMMGRIDKVYITDDHATMILEKDWIGLFFGATLTMLMFGIFLFAGGFGILYIFNLNLKPITYSATYFVSICYIFFGAIYSIRAVVTFGVCFFSERKAMRKVIADRRKRMEASGSGCFCQIQPFSYVIHLRNIGSLERDH